MKNKFIASLGLLMLLSAQLFAQPVEAALSKVPVTEGELVDNAWLAVDKKEDEVVSTKVIMYMSDKVKAGLKYSIKPFNHNEPATADLEAFHWTFDEKKQVITEAYLLEKNVEHTKTEYDKITEIRTINVTSVAPPTGERSPETEEEIRHYLSRGEYQVAAYRNKSGVLLGIQLKSGDEQIYLTAKDKEAMIKTLLNFK